MLANNGIGYFVLGFKLIQSKGIKRFVFIPLIINIILFGAAFTYLFGRIDELVTYFINLTPDWLAWIKDAIAFFVWPLAVITILLFSAYVFSTLANWIAAPFNGILSEKIELQLTGKEDNTGTVFDAIKDVPRTFAREFIKLKYYLPRALVFLLAFFFLPVIGQIIWFVFGAWMMAVQYADYPYDNHKISFDKMRADLRQKSGRSLSFGGVVMVFSMIPVINLVVMPVAICGATAMWVDHYRKLN